MSSGTTERDPSRTHAPPLELQARFDDSVDPEEVTVFPADSEGTTTEWLTIEAAYAVPLEEVR